MVGLLQLVFDDHDITRSEICRDQVEGEAANGMLSPGELEIHAERLRKYIGIVEQLAGEVVRLMAPNVADIDWRRPSS
jgi:hypothetical protein